MSVSVQRQEDSPLWTVVCDYAGPSVGVDLVWLLPGRTKSQTSMEQEQEQEGPFLKARLTYQFDLALHEGQNLTCAFQYGHGSAQRTVHVPRYCELHKKRFPMLHVMRVRNVRHRSRFRKLFPADISAVRVQNHTTPLHSRYSGEAIARRLTLQEKQRNQRILLRVEGNVPDYNLICKRWRVPRCSPRAQNSMSNPFKGSKALKVMIFFFARKYKLNWFNPVSNLRERAGVLPLSSF